MEEGVYSYYILDTVVTEKVGVDSEIINVGTNKISEKIQPVHSPT